MTLSDWGDVGRLGGEVCFNDSASETYTVGASTRSETTAAIVSGLDVSMVSFLPIQCVVKLHSV